MELTKLQTKNVLKQFLDHENGLNEVLEMFLNSLKHSKSPNNNINRSFMNKIQL